MAEDELEYPTEREAADHAYEMTVAAANIAPVVGGVLGSLIAAYWTPRLEQRRIAWFQQLAKDVEALAGDVGDLEAKLSDDAVLDAAVQAATIADRTSNEDKRRTLRAAVLNTALEIEPDDDVRAIFLRLIDDLTPSHLRMLAFVADPPGYSSAAGVQLDEDLQMGSLSYHVERVFPQWARGFYDRLATDLDDAGLSQAESALHTTMTGHGTLEPRITDFGRRFLAFVTHPISRGTQPGSPA